MQPNSPSFCFDRFRLYPSEFRFLRDEEPIPLAPKVFELLVLLVESEGHLLTRDQLMQRIWPDSFVEESNLTVNISLLRKLLGEAPDGHPYIETVPRKGYRFQANVLTGPGNGQCPNTANSVNSANAATVSGLTPALAAPILEQAPTAEAAPLAPAINIPFTSTEPHPSTPVTSTQAQLSAGAVDWHSSVQANTPAAPADPQTLPSSLRPPSKPTQKPWLARPAIRIGSLALLLAIAALSLWRLSHSDAPRVKAGAAVLAVLPFHPLNARPDDEYLGLGMTDALITRLGTLHHVVVRPIGTVRRYLAADDPIAIARHLDADEVLEGTVQKAPDRTRVTVRLLRVADGATLWSDTLDEKEQDIFALEDSISRDVASALSLTLSGTEQQRLTRPSTVNSDAYQAYLRGRYLWNKRTADGVRGSIEAFGQAIRIDPKFALAYAGLADAYILAGSYGYSILPPREAMPLARAAAEHSLALDDTLAEAHTSIAYILFTYDWDWPGAEREFRRAIALNPSYDTAHHWYSHELVALGRADEALAEAKTALSISPSDVVMNEHIGWTYMMLHRYPEAVESCRKAIALDPNFLLAHRVLGLAYLYQGNNAGALSEFQTGLTLSHNDPVAEAYVARALAANAAASAAGAPAKAGLDAGHNASHNADAQHLLDQLQARSTHDYVPPTELAAVQAALGDKSAALRSLDKAFADRSAPLAYLKVDRAYEPIRNDPAFTALLHKLNL